MIRCVAFGLALVLAMPGVGVRADTITESNIEVDASGANEAALRFDLVVRVDGDEARSAIDLYLHEAVRVAAAVAGGKSSTPSGTVVEGTWLKKWSVRTPKAVSPGDTVRLTVDAVLAPTDARGIRVDADGGALLPGSGWFPATTPTGDELPVHTSKVIVGAGWTGIAAGEPGGPGAWATTEPARPFAVWGAFGETESKATVAGKEYSFRAYRRQGTTGALPGIDTIAALVHAMEAGLGESCGTGPWRLVDVGHGAVAGGARALFWDERDFAGASTERDTILKRRDVAGALAASFWSECMRGRGDLAAWLSRAIALYIGDVSLIALDESDDRRELESVVIGSRRSSLVDYVGNDRALAGLVPISEEGEWLLATRGALVAHLAAESAPSRSHWMAFLHTSRQELKGRNVEWSDLRSLSAREFPNQLRFLEPWLRGHDLPAYRIKSHEPGAGPQKDRYKVVVENVGPIEGFVDVATITPEGNPLWSYRLQIPGGESRAVLFGDSDRIGTIVIDPRGISPQSALVDQVVDLDKRADPSREAYVPAFAFQTTQESIAEAKNLTVDFPGFSVRGFTGQIQWYSTHHGPSGAVLMGTGEVVIAPGGGFAAAVGRETLSFPGSVGMFVRFPLQTWERFESQLIELTGSHHEVTDRARQLYQQAFPTYFFQGSRAEVPPPGGGVITFTSAGGERRGFVMEPRPDGRVLVRFWDLLNGDTIWEEIR